MHYHAFEWMSGSSSNFDIQLKRKSVEFKKEPIGFSKRRGFVVNH